MNFDFHAQFADESSRKNKYKFEAWLQSGVEFVLDTSKKLKSQDFYETVALEAGFEFLKLGYSQKPEYRKYDYKTDKDCVFELIKTVRIPTGREVIVVENSLHKKYKAWNYPSKLMKNYIYESGFTECYPTILLETFLKEFEDIERQLNNV